MEVLPKRKHTRLKQYDYGSNGAYFVTICTKNKRCLLSRVVGRGLAPAVPDVHETYEIMLTEYGRIAEEQLQILPIRFPCVTVDYYVIMPNHIHAILQLHDEAAGASPRPTLMDVVCAYKFLTTRICKQKREIDRLFQTSFYEHVIRTREEYDEIQKYIEENPTRWFYDRLYRVE